MQIRLNKIERITDTIQTYWFEPDDPLRYTAGQFIELYVPHEGSDTRGQKRWFTLSSSPTEELLAITTKFAEHDSSSYKDALRRLKLGDRIHMSEPMGDFVVPMDKTIPLIFIAGGIGVTPVRSIAKWLIDSCSVRSIQLLYAASSHAEFVFQNVFNQAGVEAHNKLVGHAAKSSVSFIDTASRFVAKQLLATPNALIYISGPESMTESLVVSLRQAGIPDNRLVTDYYPGYAEI